jgi:hypothetical protein
MCNLRLKIVNLGRHEALFGFQQVAGSKQKAERFFFLQRRIRGQWSADARKA